MVNYGQLYVCVSEGIRVKYIYLSSIWKFVLSEDMVNYGQLWSTMVNLVNTIFG